MDSIERLKPIIGYNNLYEVSNHGNIKSLKRDPGNQFYTDFVPYKDCRRDYWMNLY